ncbi:MAG: hypothetical protein LBV12_12590 [Puniceicoccales bacterium]|jgi:hypothetical protein|nr:hypothetical protein [Puniceicoccales bacterium]
MKKTTQWKLAWIGVALLVIGILAIIKSLADGKLQARLSDGTIVKIEKVEVTKTPVYDTRGRMYRLNEWLNKREWGQSILWKLGITLTDDGLYFVGEDTEQEAFHIWYSVSNLQRGFFSPMFLEASSERDTAMLSSMSGISPGEAHLIDEDGCIYSEGDMWGQLLKFEDSSVVTMYAFSFTAFNRTAKRQKLSVTFPGEKQPVTFILENPSPRKAQAASPMASSLPIEQTSGEVSIVLEKFFKKKKTALETISLDAVHDWETKFRFKNKEADADKDYMAFEYKLSDSQGGDSWAVCAKASEWILKGFFCAKRTVAVKPENRAELQNLPFIQPEKYHLVDVPDATKKFVSKIYLVGAGTYVFDAANDVVSTGGLDALERQKELLEKMPQVDGTNYSGSIYSESYWDEEKRKSFFWQQKVLDTTIPRLLLLTDKPALLLRSEPTNKEQSALLVSNPALKWDLVEKDFSAGKWSIVSLDWKETDGPQSLEIGYTEAMPFEFRILPTEEMRRSVSPSGPEK